MPRESALAHVVLGEAAQWGVAEYLQAAIADALNGANWQRSGSKGAAPKPFPRPGVKDDTERRFGARRYTTVEVDEILARN